MTQNTYQQGPPPEQDPWATGPIGTPEQYPPAPQQAPWGTAPPPQQNPYAGGPPPGPAPWPPPPGVPQGVPEPGAPAQQFPGQVSPQEFQQYGQGPAAPAPNAAGNDPFNYTPPSAGGGVGMDQLVGRLLLIRPYSHDPQAPGFQGNAPSALIMADVVVCDGPPIPGSINGTTHALTPFPEGPKQMPVFFGGMYIRGAVLVPQLADFVAGRGFFLGRLYLGQPKKGQPPKILGEPTEADKAIGRAVHAQWDELKAASRPAQPDQFATAPPVQPPPGYGPPSAQGPGTTWQQQGPPQGYAPPQQYQQAPPAPYSPGGWPQQ